MALCQDDHAKETREQQGKDDSSSHEDASLKPIQDKLELA